MPGLYLDHNASAPLLPEAARAAQAADAGLRGHPNALHAPGRQAARMLEGARAAVASLVGAGPDAVVLTSGGTEADASAVFALAMATRPRAARLAVGRTEHPAVLSAVQQLVQLGLCERTWLEVDPRGVLALDQLDAVLPQVDGLLLMAANHETGVLHPLAEVAAAVRRHGTLWHCDVVQLAGRLPIDPNGPLSAAWSLALTGHKLGAPAGTGAWVVRDAPAAVPIPGRAEGARRAGTPNVSGFAGLTAAIEHARTTMMRADALGAVRDALEQRLLDDHPGSLVHGRGAARLPNTTLISLRGTEGEWVDGEDLVLELALRGVCASTGAACATGTGHPSAVLLAMDCGPAVASASLRLSLGADATPELVEPVARAVHAALRAL
jgi:cysteine desulfurase